MVESKVVSGSQLSKGLKSGVLCRLCLRRHSLKSKRDVQTVPSWQAGALTDIWECCQFCALVILGFQCYRLGNDLFYDLTETSVTQGLRTRYCRSAFSGSFIDMLRSSRLAGIEQSQLLVISKEGTVRRESRWTP